MKRKKLEKELVRYGWYFKRHGSNHDMWTNGIKALPIPRHIKVPDGLAKNILKTAYINKII